MRWDILVSGRKIEKIYSEGEEPNFSGSIVTIDCTGKYIFPGLIDLHQHFRGMDQSDKETFVTASRAAIKGGVTIACVMPNTVPRLNSVENLELMMDEARGKIYTDIGIWAGVPVVKEDPAWNESKLIDEVELEEILKIGVLGFKIYPHSSISGIDWKNELNWIDILDYVSKHNAILAIHPDYPTSNMKRKRRFDVARKRGLSNLVAHNMAYSVSDELEFITFIESLKIVDEIKNINLHFCHVSSRDELDSLKRLKERYQNLTVEVTPHHLLLSCGNVKVEVDSWAKVLPPIRLLQDKLEYPLVLDNVDVIATDHAPHTLEEKILPFFDAPSGFPSSEILLSLLCTELFKSEINVCDIVRCCSSNPAKILGLSDVGLIEENLIANIVIVEKVSPFEIDPSEFETKAQYSPYMGMDLTARVDCVILRGNIVYRENSFKKPSGKILRRSENGRV
jgi:dihydroorotase